MSWWDIVPNSNCLMALDSTCILSEGASKIHLANNSENFFETSGLRKKAVKNFYTYKVENENIKTYRSLNLDNINLFLKNTLKLPPDFTWVFLGKAVGDCSLVAAANGTSNWGFEFRTTFSGNKQAWTHQGYSLTRPIDPSVDIKSILKNSISISNTTQNVFVVNDYGAEFSQEGSFFSSNTLAGLTDFKYLGYNSSSWYPKVEIIGFGLFGKALTEAEILEIYKEMESEFLITEVKPSFDLHLDYFLQPLIEDFGVSTTSTETTLLQIYQSQASINPFLKGIESSFDIRDVQALYSHTRDIIDLVLEENIPVKTKLFLFEKYTGKLLKTTVSNIKGEFGFFNLSENLEYIVTSHDEKHQFKSILKNYNK